MSNIKLSDVIAPHFKETFLSKKTHQIDSGGRNSTKSSKNALKIAYHVISEKNCSAIILRRYQTDLRKSVYKEMKRALKRLGLVENIHYKASLAPLEIKIYSNGNTIYFAGGDDYESLKGTIDENSPIKIVWFEETTQFANEDDLEQIISTFSRGNNDWFIVLYSYNPPKNKYSWINQWAEKMQKRDNVQYTHSDYRTVPKEWIGSKALEIAESMKENDYQRYRWIYLGEVVGIEGVIFNPELIEKIDGLKEEEKVIYADFSIDSGHQVSATTCIAIGYTNMNRYILLDTYYYSPNEKSYKKAPSELSRDIYFFMLEVCKKYKCTIDDQTIDSAEGALRNQFFTDYGIRLNPVKKGKGNEEMIDYAQNFLGQRKFKVLDNYNNSIFIQEMQDYSYDVNSIEKGTYKVDKTERKMKDMYINTYTKENINTYADHTCDAFKYWVVNNKRKLNLIN